jgi:hypothetical protein
MTEGKKRGRKQLSEAEKAKRARYTITMPIEMKARLDACAEENDRKLTSETYIRLKRSLSNNSTRVMSDAFGGDRTFFCLMALAQVVSSIEAVTQDGPASEGEAGKWLDDPFVFAKVREGFMEVLDQLAPDGEQVAPAHMLMPPEYVGAANALGVLDGIRQAKKVPPKAKLDDDGVMHQFSDQLKRFPLIKAALGPDVISRIGRKK